MYAILLCALFAGDTVEPKGGIPKGQPPLMLTLELKDDKLVNLRTVTVYTPVEVTEKRIVNGQAVDVKTVKQVSRTQSVQLAWDLKKATATAGGKKIDLADLKKKFDKPRLVVISSDGKPIDSAYLGLFAKDTIVIVAPPLDSGVKGTTPGQ